MRALLETENNLLTWMGQEDFVQFGECCGAALDGLVTLGLAQIHEPGEHQSGFIVRGRGRMHRAVSLTERGRIALRELEGTNDD